MKKLSHKMKSLNEYLLKSFSDVYFIALVIVTKQCNDSNQVEIVKRDVTTCHKSNAL